MGRPRKAEASGDTKALTRPTEGTLRVMRVFETFEESIGGREKLVEAIEYTSDEVAQRLLAHLEDPRATSQGLRSVCAAARVSFPQLYHLFTDATKAKAHAEAIRVQSEYLPAVMRDTCEDAISKALDCGRCEGQGQITEGENRLVCPACRGLGTIRKPGDADARKLVFESAGLTGKRPPLVQVQHNTFDASAHFAAIINRANDAIDKTMIGLPARRIEDPPNQVSETD